MKKVFVIGGSDEFKENVKKLSNEFVEFVLTDNIYEADPGSPVLFVNPNQRITSEQVIDMIKQINDLEFTEFQKRVL